MRFFIRTFGCQMNRLDSALATDLLESRGFDRVDCAADADVVLFNTCSVRDHAENRFLSHLGRMRKVKQRRPDVVVGVLGCTAERRGREMLQEMPYVDFVCGPGRLGRMIDYLEGRLDDRCLTGFPEGEAIVHARTTRTGHVKAFVSAMRGCDRRCAYCVVPSARGPERSRRPEEIIAEIRELEHAGVGEVTLLGQSIDRYGRGLEGNVDLAALLRAVGKECGLVRLRFVTSHPVGVSEELLRTMADVPCVCESLHMPAQSGSDRILKAMGRGYTSDEYRAAVRRARELMPEMELSSDFIIGFPGETDEDLEATVRLIEECRFLQSYVFTYSPRPDTRAAALPDEVPADVKSARHAAVLALQNRISAEKHQELVGRDIEVLVEGPSKKDPSRFVGRTRRNHIAIFEPGDTRPGDLATVEVRTVTARSVYGRPVLRSQEAVAR